MNEEDRTALHERFKAMDDRDIAIENAVMLREMVGDVRKMRDFIWGNGKMGFATRVTLWLFALSTGLAVGLGVRAVDVAKWFIQ